MKHLLNNMSEEEKNSIREQHEGGKKIDTSRFKSLLESKLGNVKPLVEQFDDEDDDFGFATHDGSFDGDDSEEEEDDICPQCGRGDYDYMNGCVDCDDEENEYRWDYEEKFDDEDEDEELDLREFDDLDDDETW